MKILNEYNDYILNIVFEGVKNDETILFLSDRLIKILDVMNNPISKKLLQIAFDPFVTNKFKITMLDTNDKKDSNGNPILDSISFMMSNKAVEMAAKELDIELKKDEILTKDELKKIYNKLSTMDFTTLKGVSETSLGRIINKLFPDTYDPNKDIEPFVNQFKSLRDKSKFEIVKGNDIIYWYNDRNYAGHGQGPLNSSCMKYEECSDYIEFYAQNQDKVSLLILKDDKDDTKIRGRALLWKLSEPSDRIFMDRIYYTTEHIIELFKDYAIENDWLYKKNQNMEENELIIDHKNNTYYTEIVVKDIDDPGYGHYPYMDTLKYFNGEDLSNEGKKLKDTGYMEVLTDTDGGTMNNPNGEDDDYDDYFDYNEEE